MASLKISVSFIFGFYKKNLRFRILAVTETALASRSPLGKNVKLYLSFGQIFATPGIRTHLYQCDTPLDTPTKKTFYTHHPWIKNI